MENINVPGRRYVLLYQCQDMKGLAKLWPCKTFRGKEACCQFADKWSDPCLEHPIQIRCNECEFLRNATLCLRRCPDLRPPPYLAPEVGPVQFHLRVGCSGCNTHGTVAILRAAGHGEYVGSDVEGDDSFVFALECQVLGPFHVVEAERFGAAGLSLPSSYYFGQGLPGAKEKAKYQGKIVDDNFVPENGRSVQFSRLKLNGEPLRIDGLDGYWREASWLVDGYFEESCGLMTSDFTVSVPGWPPTSEQSQEYRQNTTFQQYCDEDLHQLMWV